MILGRHTQLLEVLEIPQVNVIFLPVKDVWLDKQLLKRDYYAAFISVVTDINQHLKSIYCIIMYSKDYLMNHSAI